MTERIESTRTPQSRAKKELKELKELGEGLLVVGAILGTIMAGSYSLVRGGQWLLVDNPKAKAAQTLSLETKLLQEKGLLGEHPIVDLQEVPGFDFNGQIAGNFLFITGTFRGQTTQMLEFAWKTNEDEKSIQISSVPVKNVVYVISDSPNAKPTVQFTGITPENFLKYPGNSNNINDFVDKAADQITILTLSKTDWEKFRGTQNK